MSSKGPYVTLAALIASAAGIVTLVFGLFGSAVFDLLPDAEGINVRRTVWVTHFAALVILLALTLLIRKQIKVADQRFLAMVAAGLVLVSLCTVGYYNHLVNTYSYVYPEDEACHYGHPVRIRGEYSAQGLLRVRRGLLDAISGSGGICEVLRTEMFWTDESRTSIINKLTLFYILQVILMTTALWVVAIAAWRSVQSRPGPRA